MIQSTPSNVRVGILESVDAGVRYSLNPFRTNSVGRAGHADVILHGSEFSRIHAVIYWDGRNWLLVDCSVNGTTVDGKSIGRHFLSPGERIRFHTGGEWIFHEEIQSSKEFRTASRSSNLLAIQPVAASCLAHAEFVGKSPIAERLRKEIEVIADSTQNVLIWGEPGAGRRRFGTCVHQSGSARFQPLVTVRCQSLTVEEIQGSLHALLLGREGELVTPGTIFLEDLGLMPDETQKALQDLLETISTIFRHEDRNQIRPRFVTILDEHPSNLQSIREPLLRRLSVAQVEIAPLRERREDVTVLARHFLAFFAGQSGKRPPRLAPAAIDQLSSYHWPGNVTELKNVLERAQLLGREDTLDVRDLSLGIGDQLCETSVYSGLSLAEVEDRHIQLTLKELRWKKSHAARVLGIERSTLDRKIQKYGIRKEDLGLQ
ncbi:MAG: FHA domain-containing protein [Planctomycetaceae bacterium]|nr:FHA domain-containing protein [Planctomycetaceae bacterium]